MLTQHTGVSPETSSNHEVRSVPIAPVDEWGLFDPGIAEDGGDQPRPEEVDDGRR
ncbi:hypothetical protein [Amycolatopsis sp. NPDC058986]|uniref:hypothetical protein n=1 Tax=unclassified Amycolatopsis TaxID=2618356 RepID=UPI00366A5A96